MAETSIRVRVPTDLHEQFSLACKNNDITASQAIRAAMREFIEANKSKSQNNEEKKDYGQQN